MSDLISAEVLMVKSSATNATKSAEPERVLERQQLATRAAGIGIWDWDVVNDELVWDEAMYQLFGIRKEHFSGAYEAWSSSLAPEDFERTTAEVQAALRGERAFDTEFRITWPDGSIHYIKAYAETFSDEGGHPIRMVGVNYDITKRRLAEEALRHSEEKFSKAFNMNPVALSLTKLSDGTLIEVNEATLKFNGLNREEMIGHTTIELGSGVTPEDRQRLLEELKTFGSVRDREIRLEQRPGEVVIGEYSGELIEVDGEQCLLSAFADITERKRAEEDAKASEERLRLTFEAAKIGTGELDLQTNQITLSDALRRIVGLPVGTLNLTFEEYSELVHSEDRARLGAVVEDAKAGQPDIAVDYRIIWPDGSVHWMTSRARTLYDEAGTATRVVAALMDITERKLAEEKLRQSESHLAAAQRLAHIGSWSRDEGANTITWSDEVYSIYGVHPAEFDPTYEVVIAFTHPDDRVLFESTVQTALETHRSFSFHYRIIRPDGNERVCHVRGAVETDEHGNPTRVYGAVQDVTEIKRADDELRKQKELLQTIFDNVPTTLSVVDKSGHLSLVNPEWERTFGWTVKELDQRNLDIVTELGPDLAERQRIQKILGAGTGEWNDFKIRTRDGRLLDVWGAVVRISDGTSIGIANDVTERKKAEELLRENKKELNEAQRVAKVGSWVWDIESDVVTWSDELYHLTGHDPALPAPTYAELRSLYTPQSWERLSTAVERAKRSGEPYELEVETILADGRLAWRAVRGEALRDSNGRIVKLRGTSQDITERKRSEEQLKSSTARLRALSARLESAREEEGMRIAREIHDELGSALTGLKWDIEGLDKILAGAADDRQLQSAQLRIPTITKLIDETINTVRRIASELRPGVLDDLGLVAAIEWQAQQFEHRTGIRCTFVAPWDDIDLRQDQATTIFRVFQEILTNVLRHSQATQVDVKMSKDSQSFELEVKDNGRGITESEKSNTKSLGLLGMRERVQLIGGKIQIEGQAGKGTVVVVSVPIE